MVHAVEGRGRGTVVAAAEAVGAKRFKSAAREALAGVDSAERKP